MTIVTSVARTDYGVDCSARAAAVSAGVRRGSAVSRCLTSEPDIYPANVLASWAGLGWLGWAGLLNSNTRIIQIFVRGARRHQGIKGPPHSTHHFGVEHYLLS